MLDDASPDQAASAPVDSVTSEPVLHMWNGLLERLPVGLYTCDRLGNLVHCNQRAALLWGRSPKPGEPEDRYCGAWRRFRPDGTPLPREEAPMAELLRLGKAIRDREIVLERPDGTRITVLADLDPVLDSEGACVGGICCFHDITERTQAEARLRERERRFGELLEALPAAIYTTDQAGRINFYNDAAVELWGCRPELGSSEWCGSWRLYMPDGTPLPHDECPMAVALKENRPVRGAEATAERPDGSRVPFIPYPTPLRDASGRLVGAVNMLVDITERKQAEMTQKLLVGELNHRVKNTLASVQAIAQLTLSHTKRPADFVPSFNGRLQSLSRAHTLLTQSSWQGAGLKVLVCEQLLLDAAADDRITCDGPEVVLAPEMALHLALVLHELGTNARKYGALSVPEGRLSVSWAVETTDTRLLHLEWVEAGGPPVMAPGTPGFGTVLVEQSVTSHGGRTRMLSRANGISWEISLPLAKPARDALDRRLDASGSAPGRRVMARGADARADRARILVIEDEPLVAIEIASRLAEARMTVVGPVGTVDEALRLITIAQVDAALLDANLNGSTVEGIAAELTRRGVPFAFVTGYGRDSLPKSFQTAAVLAKPFAGQELAETTRRLLAPAEAEIVPLRARTSR